MLSSTVRDVRDSAQQTFFDIMKVHGDKLLRYPTPVAVDLSPPPAVGDGVSLLLELIDTHEKIMVSAGGKKPDFDPIISAILDPLKEVSCPSFSRYLSQLSCLCRILQSLT